MSIKSERDAYKAMATHMALALMSVAVCTAIGVGIVITHNGWCLMGLIVVLIVYSAALDHPSLHQEKKGEAEVV